MTNQSSDNPSRHPSGQDPSLPRQRLGRAGIDISVLSLGGAGLGGLYQPVPEGAAVQTIHRALALGVNYFDNSPFYGKSEQRFGRALNELGGLPADTHICTKTGTHPDRYEDYSAAATRWSVNNSLQILGLDRVDLVQVHALEHIDMDVVLAPDGAVAELERLREDGKVRAIGLGVRGADFHRRAIECGRFDVILVHDDYTLVRQTDLPLLNEAGEAGVGVLLGRALLMGLLTGIDPQTVEHLADHPDMPMARDWWLWAREREIPLRALAIQFPMRHPAVSSVVVGASSTKEIEESVAAATFPIPDAIWAEVDERMAQSEK